MGKSSCYSALLHEAEMLLGEGGKYIPDQIGRMAISAAILFRHLPDLVFAGYYINQESELIIGPYQGNIIACTPIQMGKGACGTCVKKREPIIIPDVRNYPNYIACDGETLSEIVLPVFVNNNLIGVLDIDGRHADQFNDDDAQQLTTFLRMIF
mgnify:CR=1 FL=1